MIADHANSLHEDSFPKSYNVYVLTSVCVVPFDSVGRGSCVKRSVDVVPVLPG